MQFIVSVMRYIAPAAAVFILFTSVISLFRNRPRVHKLARLIDQNDGTIIDIDHWETSIGKSRSNDIVLNYDDVARFQAVISKKRRDWVITDTSAPALDFITKILNRGKNAIKSGRDDEEDEYFPVYVNGRIIDTSAPLENGDLIKIGEIPFKFECDEALSSTSRQELRSVAGGRMNTNIAYGVLVDVKTKRPVYLKKTDVLIGRGNNADIQLMSQAVSSEHARIYKTSRGWALADLDSHNGTKLNGRFITEPQLIFDEDMLTFGDKVFIFYEK